MNLFSKRIHQIKNPDLDLPKGTRNPFLDLKSVFGFTERNTPFNCALSTTEYFTQYENLADTANDLSKVLSNVQSTCLSHKLKVSVQGKVKDSRLFYFKTNTWK